MQKKRKLSLCIFQAIVGFTVKDVHVGKNELLFMTQTDTFKTESGKVIRLKTEEIPKLLRIIFNG